MRVLSLIAAAGALLGAAHAAPVAVANADFEASQALTNSNAFYGEWENSADSWDTEGKAGVWAPNFGNFFPSTPAAVGDQIGFAAAGATMSQDLGITIGAGQSFTLSALIGDRSDKSFGGVFGFYAGDPSNIIASTALVSSGDGMWGLQEFSVLATALVGYVGQELGIFFSGTVGQVNFDGVSIVSDGDVIVNPLPGAVWLFGTALAGGVFAKRKKKSAIAAS